ncbi:polysaccharide lyase family 1 protein [Amniculicola lignicola CBS 123094]|uniref:Polysaccharide lyase family 1 protein n=1 Tax=Amniculicola lignicola CBS 123094 TaxID=1392246 RepID=A0A6A5WR73_9PLEO|nr:polysaccharide lyase family 1 protein [Amniculicola lignicola CBS 123094]
MKPSTLLSYASLAVAAVAWPFGPDYSLVGFAKNNPIGPTTGGKGGKTVVVKDVASLRAAIGDDVPRIVIAKGTFNLTKTRLLVGSHKSLIGYGKGAEIVGAGITVANKTNVIIQNLGIRFILDNDGITLTNSTRVWVDHNEFESDMNHGPDYYDGQCDIVRGSDWVTVSWNYFHDHWKSSLVGNSDVLRSVDQGHLHITYHHNYWRNEGTRGNAGRFGHQHLFNNFYKDFRYQAIHSRSDNQVLVEGNVFRGDTPEPLSTYGLVVPMDSPNTSPDGDYEIDGFANLGAKNDWGHGKINITQWGNFTRAPYKYKLTALRDVEKVVKSGAGLGKI